MTHPPDPTLAALIAIRHWRDKSALARYAGDRHGFGDSDGGFGVTYPSDLDDADRGTAGADIPASHVLAYGRWGDGHPDGWEVLVPEPLFLAVLAEVLECCGMREDAARVRLITSRPSTDGPRRIRGRCHD
jgi:hypothetical protein